MTTLKENIKILIIDDEESIRLTFKLFLTRDGYKNVTTAATAQEAYDAINEESFDLIISDIVLAGHSGIEILRHIKDLGINCPVIMVTGFPNLETASEAVRLGAFDYLPKPVMKDSLLRVTKQALNHRELIKENTKYKNYLEAIFRSVGDAIITVNKNMEIVHLNDTAMRLMNATNKDEIINKELDLLANELGSSCLKDAQKVITTQQEVRDHRIECQHPDGSKSVFSLNAAPLRNDKGSSDEVVLVARDVTFRNINKASDSLSHFHGYTGHSLAMQKVYKLIANVGKVDTSVLIKGESGTGKELAAEALHAESSRHSFPLIKVDCSAIADNILESELFGHKKGAFTGAESNRQGRILQAKNGTLFLDEIGDISPRMQLRLLRFLQEKTFYPVGQDTPITIDVRIIAATNADLQQKVKSGLFREDLYYRLCVIEIDLPPLRERKDGFKFLTNHFINYFSNKLNAQITNISDQALATLTSYNWPGNVRELKHVIERACVLCDSSTISRDHLPKNICNYQHITHNNKTSVVINPEPSEKITSTKDQEKQQIIDALQYTGGNKAKAARILKIDRSTLYRKITKYRLP